MKFRKLETYRDFFRTMKLLEHRLVSWIINASPSPLADYLHPCIPPSSSDKMVALGELFAQLNDLAMEHGCRVSPPKADIADLRLCARSTHAICLFIVSEAAGRCRNPKALEDIRYLGSKVVGILDELSGVEHPPKDPFADFQVLFTRAAQRSFEQEIDRPEILNHSYLALRSSGVENLLRQYHCALPGLFHDTLFAVAIQTQASVDGKRQALKARARLERSGCLEPV